MGLQDGPVGFIFDKQLNKTDRFTAKFPLKIPILPLIICTFAPDKKIEEKNPGLLLDLY